MEINYSKNCWNVIRNNKVLVKYEFFAVDIELLVFQSNNDLNEIVIFLKHIKLVESFVLFYLNFWETKQTKSDIYFHLVSKQKDNMFVELPLSQSVSILKIAIWKRNFFFINFFWHSLFFFVVWMGNHNNTVMDQLK